MRERRFLVAAAVVLGLIALQPDASWLVRAAAILGAGACAFMGGSPDD